MYKLNGKISEDVVSIDLGEPDYSFYLLGVWKTEDGYYLSTDSGCSCPMPWENHSEGDFTGPLTAEQAIEEATSLWLDAGSYDEEQFASAMKLIV